jgi:hypothetical protein
MISMDGAVEILVNEGRAERVLINGEPGLRLIRKDQKSNVRNRIVEVLAKYNVRLEMVPLEALTIAVERLIESAVAVRK